MMNRKTVISRRNEFGEYRVRLYVDGKAVPEADYFTDDKVDAEETAVAMTRK